MTLALIRSGEMITRALDRHRCETVPDGALLVEGGTIAEVGSYSQLSARFPTAEVIGSGEHILLPGFVNAHHHVGLTPFQLGVRDDALELWSVARLGARDVDPYLDTLYSAFEMISSGITTVQHIHDGVAGDLPAIEARLQAIIRAYEDVGMRASICYGFDDQNRFALVPDADFLASLPDDLRRRLARELAGIKVGVEGNIDLFKSLLASQRGARRIRVQLAPANLHWCSDEALKSIADAAQQYNVPVHMHLLETPFQRDYAGKRCSAGAFQYLDRFGLLGPQTTIGHAVWFTQRDVDAAVEAGVSVCHNCSSNLRLRSGRAPLNALHQAGVNLAIGIDEAGINDDRDMLQEIRLVLRTHRDPGIDDTVPGIGQVLRMATEGGARTTGFASRIGRLEPGMAADVTLFDRRKLAYPYLDSGIPAADAVLMRAKSSDVSIVVCDGEVIYRDGVFTRVDREAILSELQKRMAHGLSRSELKRRQLAQALLPHIRSSLKSC